jgi:hypothetical protein
LHKVASEILFIAKTKMCFFIVPHNIIDMFYINLLFFQLPFEQAYLIKLITSKCICTCYLQPDNITYFSFCITINVLLVTITITKHQIKKTISFIFKVRKVFPAFYNDIAPWMRFKKASTTQLSKS